MGKRAKSAKPAIIAIKDWEHADRIIREIGDATSQIDILQHNAKVIIDRTKANLASNAKYEQDSIDQLVRSLEAFAIAHRSDFKKTRSRKLNFGVLGWRQSKSIGTTKATTVDYIRERLTAVKAKMCIIVKETVSKDGLAKLTDEQLACVGARRKVKDDFFVEPDIPEAADLSS